MLVLGYPMLRWISEYVKEEEGGSAAEYALMLALIGAAIASACIVLGQSIHGAISTMANCMANASSGGC